MSTEEKWERWRSRNRQITAAGGTITTLYCRGGHVLEYATLNGETVDNSPPLDHVPSRELVPI